MALDGDRYGGGSRPYSSPLEGEVSSSLVCPLGPPADKPPWSGLGGNLAGESEAALRKRSSCVSCALRGSWNRASCFIRSIAERACGERWNSTSPWSGETKAEKRTRLGGRGVTARRLVRGVRGGAEYPSVDPIGTLGSVSAMTDGERFNFLHHCVSDFPPQTGRENTKRSPVLHLDWRTHGTTFIPVSLPSIPLGTSCSLRVSRSLVHGPQGRRTSHCCPTRHRRRWPCGTMTHPERSMDVRSWSTVRHVRVCQSR